MMYWALIIAFLFLIAKIFVTNPTYQHKYPDSNGNFLNLLCEKRFLLKVTCFAVENLTKLPNTKTILNKKNKLHRLLIEYAIDVALILIILFTFINWIAWDLYLLFLFIQFINVNNIIKINVTSIAYSMSNRCNLFFLFNIVFVFGSLIKFSTAKHVTFSKNLLPHCN